MDRKTRLEELFETAVSSRVTIPRIDTNVEKITLDPDAVRELVHAAIDLDHTLVESAPDHVLTGDDARKVAETLDRIVRTALNLAPGTAEPGVEGRETLDVTDSVIVVVRGNERKAVKDVLPEATVVQVGGPLIPEDYRKVNPNIPEPLPEGIVKRAERARRELKEAIRKKDPETVVLLRSPEDEVADVIEEELKGMEEDLGVEVRVVNVDFDDLAGILGGTRVGRR